MGRGWIAMLLVLLPAVGRAQSLADLGMAMSGQGAIARTSAASAAPVLDSVKRSLQASQTPAAGGWGQSRGTAANGWKTGGPANGGAAGGNGTGCWASNNGGQRGASSGWATASNQSSTGRGWAKGGEKTR